MESGRRAACNKRNKTRPPAKSCCCDRSILCTTHGPARLARHERPRVLRFSLFRRGWNFRTMSDPVNDALPVPGEPAGFRNQELAAVIPRLRRYALVLTGNPVRGDDLVQDTLTRAWDKRSYWRPGSDLRAWVFTIMHNIFVNQLA